MTPQPRALLTWSVAALTIALITTNPIHRLLLLLVAGNVVVAVRRRGAKLKPLLLMCGIAGMVSLLITALLSHSGKHLIVSLPETIPGFGGPITWEAMAFGLSSAIGVTAAVLAASPLLLAVDADALLDAAPKRLERTAAAVGGALTLLPRFSRSVSAIHEVQHLRGLTGSKIRTARHVFIPAVLTAVEDSVQLAAAMEARGFGSGPRTRLQVEKSGNADRLVMLIASAALLFAVAARLRGGLSDWYPYPALSMPSLDVASVVCAVLLLSPLLLWRRP